MLSAPAAAGEGLRALDPDADPGRPGAEAGAVRRGAAAVADVRHDACHVRHHGLFLRRRPIVAGCSESSLHD